MSDLCQLTVTCLSLNSILLVLDSFKRIKITFIVGKFLALEVDYLIHSSVEEITSMGHDNDSAV
jgi:hypothetical protein